MNTNYKFDIEMYKTVAKNIKKYMALKNITLESLSEYAEIKSSFLTRFLNESEDVKISIYDLYKISVILDVSINEFFVS